MKRIIGYFFQGLLLIAPLAITAYVVYKIMAVFGTWSHDFGLAIHPAVDPIIGLIVVFVIIMLIGMLSTTLLLKPLFSIFEQLVSRTPLIKIVYSALKDLFSAFVSDKKRFDQPVLVNISKKSGLQKLGFITREDLTPLGIPDKVAVYLPHSYNFSGNLFIVSREDIILLEGISSTEVMKFIVSGGVTEIEEIQEQQS